VSVLAGHFPDPSDSRRVHSAYVRNLLGVIDYAPELQPEILGLITERLIKIDVQVQEDLEDLAEDIGEGVVQAIPRLSAFDGTEGDDTDTMSDDESALSDEPLDPDVQRAKEITGNVQKMDLILDILFSHYASMLSSSSPETRESVMDVLLSQFGTILLPTYRSRHTQFLLFHFAQSTPALIDTFVGTCIEIILDRRRAPLIRQSAAAYLASFVARGKHVSPQIVRDVFDYIGNHLADLQHAAEPTCRGPDLRRYPDYYALVQALLYIFCFRWQDLEASSEEQFDDEDLPLTALAETEDQRPHIWVRGVKDTLTSNIFCKLNPLKVCSPAIVAEFAKIAHHLGLLYVFHLLEANKRLRINAFPVSTPASASGYDSPMRETALSAKKDENQLQLDEYFPFDPYRLPRSKRWIEGDYREWTGIPGLHDHEDGSDGEDRDVEDESEAEVTGTDEAEE
jgi:RNA polymerase I-specific transcription initiation factor RRN3